MRFITERTEIARLINIERLPTITIDIGACMRGYADCYEGSKIRIATPSPRHPDLYARCVVDMFGDDAGNEDHDRPYTYKTIRLHQGPTCITNSFGYHDVIEMVEWSNAPMVNAGDRVVVIFKNEFARSCQIRLMRIGKRIDRFCSTVTYLEDVDE